MANSSVVAVRDLRDDSFDLAKKKEGLMQNILSDFSVERLVKQAIKENWENYHYCLGCSPSVELSIGRYLTWFVTNMPDYFMNLVVCTDLPDDGIHELIGSTLAHFRSLNI